MVVLSLETKTILLIFLFLAKKAAGIEIKFKNPKKKSDADLRPDDGKKTKWTNSSKVFRLLQEKGFL